MSRCADSIVKYLVECGCSVMRLSSADHRAVNPPNLLVITPTGVVRVVQAIGSSNNVPGLLDEIDLRALIDAGIDIITAESRDEVIRAMLGGDA